MKNISHKLSVIFLVLFIPFVATAKGEDTIVHLKQSPLMNGYTVSHPDKTHQVYNPNIGIYIYSDKQDVFSMSGGTVTSCFSLGSTFTVLIKSHDTFFVYNSLYTANVKNGDPVAKSMKLGTLSKNADANGAYELDFQVWLANEKQKALPIRLEAGEVLGYMN